MTDMTAAQTALSVDNGPETPTADGPSDAQETATEAPIRSSDAQHAETAARLALDAVRVELAGLRAERDGPIAERIRSLVADEDRLRRVVAIFDKATP
jgi:hypothetical protein